MEFSICNNVIYKWYLKFFIPNPYTFFLVLLYWLWLPEQHWSGDSSYYQASIFGKPSIIYHYRWCFLYIFQGNFFYQIKKDPFFPSLLWVFNRKWELKLIKCFFCFYRNDHIIFFHKYGKWYQFKKC